MATKIPTQSNFVPPASGAFTPASLEGELHRYIFAVGNHGMDVWSRCSLSDEEFKEDFVWAVSEAFKLENLEALYVRTDEQNEARFRGSVRLRGKELRFAGVRVPR